MTGIANLPDGMRTEPADAGVLPGDKASEVSAAAEEGAAAAPRRPQGRGSLWRSGRAVWVLAGVAVLGLVIGYLVGTLVVSPDQAAAPTPVEGLITAKVEARQITATVVGRADVAYTDRIDVVPTAPEGAVAAVVTGQVPEVGAQVEAGKVILEVSGRPVFVLPGAFPSYRSLGAGSSGTDVTELRAALTGLGLDAGPESDAYDASLAQAVRALYERAGYSAADGGDAAAQSVRAAQDSVTDASTGAAQASSGVDQAEKALSRAQADQTRARSDYDQALADQRSAGAAPRGSASSSAGGSSTGDASAAAATVDQAKAALEQAGDAVDQAQLGLQQAKDSLAAAQRGVTRAQAALTDAQRAAWATVPVGSVVFVPDLPRRVDEVNVAVGDDLADLVGEAMGQMGSGSPPAPIVLSGAQVAVTAQVGMAEAGLLTVGGPAELTLPGGGTVQGQIDSICDLTGASGQAGADQTARCAVGVTLTDLGGASVADLVGNLQVTMTVGTSSPDSLLVPVAAVSADTAGRARITVVDGQLVPGVAARDQKTTVVQVETGVSAEGMVEITSATPPIAAGDLVVIGQGASQPTAAETPR